MRSYGPDYENSVLQSVREVYGPKFQAMHTDTDVRLAFGRSYPHEQGDGTLFPETRYEVAVYLPIETVRNLAEYLTNLLATNYAKPKVSE